MINLRWTPLILRNYRPFSSFATKEISNIILSPTGGLDNIGPSIDQLGFAISPETITSVIDTCNASSNTGSQITSRRLFRFFTWCQSQNPDGLADNTINHALKVFVKMGDLTASSIIIEQMQRKGQTMTRESFSLVMDVLVKAGKPDEAVRVFRSLERQRLLPQCSAEGDEAGVWSSSLALINALCAKGHSRQAEGVVFHHKSQLSAQPFAGLVLRNLLHGWCVHGNVREARRVMEEIKSKLKSSDDSPGLGLGLYNDLLRCLCHRNLKFNPSGLVPESLDLMEEMSLSGISPDSTSFNILLSSLSRARRVKEACRILYSMRERKNGFWCSPDWVCYYLVIRVLFLTGRFVRGIGIVDQMVDDGVFPGFKFYHGLIGLLCGLEKVEVALELFNRMKKWCGEVNGKTYDLLIEKLYRNGKFETGRVLWDEAVERGITLECSRDLLDPVKTKQYKLVRPMGKRVANTIIKRN